MANMLEQLTRPSRKDLYPPIGDIVGNGEQSRIARQARKHERALEKLGEPFEDIGKKWLGYLKQESPSAKPIREEWQNLLPQLTKIQESERPELIRRLAKGLMLSEDNTNSVRNAISDPFFKYSGDFQEMPNGVRLSLKSRYFIGVISDLSGYYDKERASLIDFVSTREDLPGLVRLPQVLPAVAEWLVQSRSNSQSSKLS